MTDNGLTGLTETDRRLAMSRFEVLRPYLEDGVPLARADAASRTPLRTAQRWLHRYRASGLAGLAPTTSRIIAGQGHLSPFRVDGNSIAMNGAG